MNNPVDVDIWQFYLDEAIDVEASLKLLSVDEVNRYQRFVTEELKYKHLVAHATKRKILSQYVDLPPESIGFVEGEHGKPAIKNSKWQFNISHAGNLGLLAVVNDAAIGIDVEQVSRKIEVKEISERFFTKDECAYIASAAPHEKEAFFRIWVRKEAVVKMLGEGLMRALDSFNVACDLDDQCFQVEWFDDNDKRMQYCARHFEVDSGYKAAVVVSTQDALLQCKCWPSA